MSDAKTKNKKTATTIHPTIKAVLKSLYRFADEKQAMARVEQLKHHFVSSKSGNETPGTAVIWIRGYELTKDETAKGYTGNFATIRVKKADKKFTLTATKLVTDLGTHPQRNRPKQKHPDWGHPILRDIKKKRLFESAEAAAQELMRLHEEFPEVSIPDEARLMIILYEKAEGKASPVQKYKFDVRPNPEGGFVIAYQKNLKPIQSKMPGAKAAPLPKEAESSYFTQMIATKRKKKPNKPEN